MASPVYRFPRPAPEPRPTKLVFADFELHVETRELFRAGRAVKLQDQPARLLELLASRPGQLVERDEIRRRLWGDAVNVDFDQGINFCVKQLRRALEDSAARPRCVETVPRRGYRFVAPVERAAIPEDELARLSVAARRRRPRPSVSLLAIAAAVAALALLAAGGLRWRRSEPAAPAPAEALPAAAREAYLEGVYLLQKDDADPALARAALRRSVELAPAFAPAHARLAEALLRGEPAATAAEAQARRALELDPQLAPAHVVMGRILFYVTYDWDAAGRELQRAIELDPELARAYHQYAGWLSARGRHEEALAAAERARRLDPGSLLLAADVGLFAYFARRWDQAIAESRRVLALDPGYVWAQRWILYAAQERGSVALALEQARAEVAAAVERRGARTPEGGIGSLEDYWRWRLARMREIVGEDRAPPAQLAMLYLGAGERERALEVLGVACERHAGWRAPYLGVHPFFDPLRSEPRFQAVLECLGLVGG